MPQLPTPAKTASNVDLRANTVTNRTPETPRPATPARAGVREVAHRGQRFSAFVSACGARLAALAGTVVLGTAALGTAAFGSTALPAQDDAIRRLVAADAARWTKHGDPVVRGEAALVVASTSDQRHHAAVVAVANDRDQAARLRGILALGIQGTPGVVEVLTEQLERYGDRTQPEGICAAYALGALSPSHAPTFTSRILASFAEGNWKRQRDAMVALLAGLARHSDHGQTAALEQLYGYRANKDPAVRARLLELLLPQIGTDLDSALDLLDKAGSRERLVLLDWLADNATDFDKQLIGPLEKMCKGARSAELRARALGVLTRLRHPPAIEFAVQALRSSHTIEVEQGMRSAQSIGGAGMRLTLDRHIRSTDAPLQKAAMLRSWASPPTDELVDHCADLTANRRTPMTLRLAAARTLAQADPDRAAPLLRDLVRGGIDYDGLCDAAMILLQGTESPPIDRLLPDPPQLDLHPAHWTALVAASHPGAVRTLLETLGDTAATPNRLRSALAAWRQPMVTGKVSGAADLPVVLRELLQPR